VQGWCVVQGHPLVQYHHLQYRGEHAPRPQQRQALDQGGIRWVPGSGRTRRGVRSPSACRAASHRAISPWCQICAPPARWNQHRQCRYRPPTTRSYRRHNLTVTLHTDPDLSRSWFEADDVIGQDRGEPCLLSRAMAGGDNEDGRCSPAFRRAPGTLCRHLCAWGARRVCLDGVPLCGHDGQSARTMDHGVNREDRPPPQQSTPGVTSALT
jgi:hypothetical protein